MAATWKTIDDELEDLISHEQGIVFQRLCVALAKKRWSNLVATEIKKDGGEDAMAVGEFALGSKRFRVACSLTGTLAKVRKDAQRIRQRGVVLDELIFYAANKIMNTTLDQWKPTIRKEFGHDLSVISREDIIQELLNPQNSWLVSTYLKTQSESGALANWERITFENQRGLGPALMGRSLGPSDVEACPTLDEVKTVLAHLQVAYSARVSGGPGAGKSLCAYQVGYALSKAGRSMYRLRRSYSGAIDFVHPAEGNGAIYFVDDAHLLQPGVLEGLEEQANEEQYVVSTFNEIQTTTAQHHTIDIDANRAVQTIASRLGANPIETLSAVRAADSHVGEYYGDIQLTDRIDEAVAKSSFPWQFCFVLGGGWRRADQAAKRVKDAGHDVVLTALALYQLASRDASLSVGELADHCRTVDIPIDSVYSAVQWLADIRLVVSTHDIRCPHQRFASVILGKIFSRLSDDDSKRRFAALVRGVLSDPSVSIAGLYIVLDELGYQDSVRWHLKRILDEATRETVLGRCWAAETPVDRSHAGLVLTALGRYTDSWPKSLLESKISLIAGWISAARSTDGYGLGRLINDVWNDDEELCKAIVAKVQPQAMAVATSSAKIDDISAVAFLVDRLSLGATTTWKSEFGGTLDKSNLLTTVSNWPDLDRLFVLAKLCNAISHFDEEFSLDLAEAALPKFRQCFELDPIGTFEQLNDLLGQLLRVWDPLGVYKGPLRPDGRRKAIARRLIRSIQDDQLASAISSATLRDFEPAARLLSVVRELCPRRFDSMSKQIDWSLIEETIGDAWAKLNHGAVVLLCQLSIRGDGRDVIPTILERNVKRIETMDARLAIVSPVSAFGVVEKGGQIALKENMTFGWDIVAYVVHQFGEKRPDLLRALLLPHEHAVAEALGRDQANTFSDVDAFVDVMQEYAPDNLDRILSEVDPSAAKTAWQSCLCASGKPRRAAAKLVQLSIEYGGTLGDVGVDLRHRFPAASVAAPKDGHGG